MVRRPARLEGDQVADDPERVAAALPRRDHPLHLVGEEERADPVVLVRRRERQHRGDLDREPRLGHRLAEPGRPRLVHHEHQGELPLLGEGLDVGAAEAGRDVPVDGAEVVAVLVGPHLGELHPLPSEDRAVLAGEQRADEPAGAELDGLDLLQDFGGDGGMR